VECGELEHVDTFRMDRHELMSQCAIVDAAKLEEAFAYFDEKILPDAATMKKESGQYFSTKSMKSPFCRTKEWAIDNVLGLVACFCVSIIVLAIWRRWRGKQRENLAVEAKVVEALHILEECGNFEKQPFVPVELVRQRTQCQSEAVWRRVNARICADGAVRKSVKFIDGTHKNCWQMAKVTGQRGFDGNSKDWSPGGVVRDENQQWKFGNGPEAEQQGAQGYGYGGQQLSGNNQQYPAYSKSRKNRW